jgi:hypothetical protein
MFFVTKKEEIDFIRKIVELTYNHFFENNISDQKQLLDFLANEFYFHNRVRVKEDKC